MPSKTKTAPKFTDAERAAMKERARELKAATDAAAGEADAVAKIGEMPAADRVLAERVHALVKTAAPGLTAKTYYGMPAYARDGKVVFWFKSADKFKTRYATLGFSDQARLDDGETWPTEYAVTGFSAATERRLRDLIERAVS